MAAWDACHQARHAPQGEPRPQLPLRLALRSAMGWGSLASEPRGGAWLGRCLQRAATGPGRLCVPKQHGPVPDHNRPCSSNHGAGRCSRRSRALWVQTAPTTRPGGSCARCSSAACTTCSRAGLQQLLRTRQLPCAAPAASLAPACNCPQLAARAQQQAASSTAGGTPQTEAHPARATHLISRAVSEPGAACIVSAGFPGRRIACMHCFGAGR